MGIPPGSEEQAREFYTTALGFEEIPKPPHLAVRGGLWFRTGAHQVHLGIEPEFHAMERPHVALHVEGLAELRARLERHGVTIVEDLPLPGFRRFYAKDPFGNRLEFVEPEHKDTERPRVM
ncbi:MAG: VOC family protein [Thermoplasmata archaeon]|nr:VOC family protein [Thermoplasmata archaeon]